MSAGYSFVSFFRQGIANAITGIEDRSKGELSTKTSSKIAVGVYNGVSEIVTKEIDLYGPGDVIGIDKVVIIRTDPCDFITNFEPNYLASIEFYEEDFPWKFSPSSLESNDIKLTPWLALVVLNEDEFDLNHLVDEKKPLPSFKLKQGVTTENIFPKIKDMWAWAHVHVNEDIQESLLINGGSPGSGQVKLNLQSKLDNDGDYCYSRIICPRRLEQNTSYHAFLIPVFDAGRKAGLGEDVSGISVTKSAWEDLEQNEFPIYYRWYFRTGNMGDFEYLVKQIKPKPADKKVGARDLFVKVDESKPGAQEFIISLPGALRVPSNDESINPPLLKNWKTNMQAKINLADDYQITDQTNNDPVVTMPLYGQWHALVKRLGIGVNWVNDLNLDPSYRAIAGMGANVVRKNQEEYMDAAWKQIDKVKDANSKIRYVQLANELNKTFQSNVMGRLSTEQLIAFTVPLHKQTLLSSTLPSFGSVTIHKAISDSSISNTFSTNLFRKVTRNTGRLSKFNSSLNDLKSKVFTGEFKLGGNKLMPTGAIGMNETEELMNNLLNKLNELEQQVPQVETKFDKPEDVVKTGEIFIDPKIEVKPEDIFIDPKIEVKPGNIFIDPKIEVKPDNIFINPKIEVKPDNIFIDPKIEGKLDLGKINNPTLEDKSTGFDIPPLHTGSPIFEGISKGPKNAPLKTPSPTPFTLGSSIEFKTESVSNSEVFKIPIANTQIVYGFKAEAEIKVEISADSIKETLDSNLKATPIFRNILNNKYKFASGDKLFKLDEPIKPVMAYPIFNIPMYRPLKDISYENFLPNINLIEQNSFTLLETNPKFIEAFMVGLNHEMARELLWREYPTDQRGSYFRMFWDSVSEVPKGDIEEIHKWRNRLGENALDSFGGTNTADKDGLLVFVIRGDLLKKYPNTVVKAQEAKFDSSGELIGDIKMPVLEAKIDPDIYFLGFSGLDEMTAKGDENSPGWFFVLEERVGESRFGFDLNDTALLKKWSDVSWGNIGALPGQCIQLENTIPFTPSVDTDDTQVAWPPADSAQMAYILYQQPVKIAVHASRLLPS